ncbi:MAG: hypothetical protein L3J22_03175 [Xanthomonadales bacterium]|nr:hypothetical protein [Xanthomonadales bacterium]
MEHLGRVLFVIGIIASAAAGLGLDWHWLPWTLVLLGAIVGIINITATETRTFLIAGIALTLSATAFRDIPAIGDVVTQVVSNILLFVSGALFIVAMKALFDTGKD